MSVPFASSWTTPGRLGHFKPHQIRFSIKKKRLDYFFNQNSVKWLKSSEKLVLNSSKIVLRNSPFPCRFQLFRSISLHIRLKYAHFWRVFTTFFVASHFSIHYSKSRHFRSLFSFGEKTLQIRKLLCTFIGYFLFPYVFVTILEIPLDFLLFHYIKPFLNSGTSKGVRSLKNKSSIRASLRALKWAGFVHPWVLSKIAFDVPFRRVDVREKPSKSAIHLISFIVYLTDIHKLALSSALFELLKIRHM